MKLEHSLETNPQQVALVFNVQSDRDTYHRITHMVNIAADIWDYAETIIEELTRDGFVVNAWKAVISGGNYYG